MKRILSIFALVIILALAVLPFASFAEGGLIDIPTEAPAGTPATPAEEGDPSLAVTETGEEDFSLSAYFRDKILPVLLSSSGVLLILAPFIKVLVKTKNTAKSIKTAFKAKCSENETLQAIVDAIDIDKIVGVVEERLTARFGELCAKIDSSAGYEEVKADLAVLCAKTEALCGAALNTWRGNPEAVALLSEPSDRTAVEKLSAQNIALVSIIKEIKGAEADEIIAKAGV